MYRLLLLFSLLVAVHQAIAEDILVTVSNDSLRGKVLNMTTEKIRFRPSGARNEAIREINKNQIRQIIYENGSTLNILMDQFQVPSDLLIKERHFVIKGDFGSPFLNHLTIGCEYRLKLGRNLEVKGGYIGLKASSFTDQSKGFLIKAGLKFVMCKEVQEKGLVYKHPMKGVFVKPEIIYTDFNTIQSDHTKVYYRGYALVINFGNQLLIFHRFTFEYYGGAGYGVQTSTFQQGSPYDRNGNDLNYSYSHIFMGKKLPLVLTGGLMVGVVF